MRNDLHIFRDYCFDCVYANKEWMEMAIKDWWFKFVEWRLRRQSKKFAEELKRKNYKPRQPWDNGIWK